MPRPISSFEREEDQIGNFPPPTISLFLFLSALSKEGATHGVASKSSPRPSSSLSDINPVELDVDDEEEEEEEDELEFDELLDETD